MRMVTGRSRSRGQSLVEFALVAPLVVAVMAAIIQFGIVFWAQNTLTQIVRDTGRWAATQQNCSDPAPIVTQANAIAANSSLMSYSSSAWAQPGLGVTVTFLPDASTGSGGITCPPKDNKSVDYVKVMIRHQVPTFFPGMEFLPALGGPCIGSSGICMTLSSTAQFRLEPQP